MLQKPLKTGEWGSEKGEEGFVEGERKNQMGAGGGPRGALRLSREKGKAKSQEVTKFGKQIIQRLRQKEKKTVVDQKSSEASRNEVKVEPMDTAPVVEKPEFSRPRSGGRRRGRGMK